MMLLPPAELLDELPTRCCWVHDMLIIVFVVVAVGSASILGARVVIPDAGESPSPLEQAQDPDDDVRYEGQREREETGQRIGHQL